MILWLHNDVSNTTNEHPNNVNMMRTSDAAPAFDQITIQCVVCTV